MSREDTDLRMLILAATIPYPMVRRTAREAWTAPRKLARMPLDISKRNSNGRFKKLNIRHDLLTSSQNGTVEKVKVPLHEAHAFVCLPYQ
jgi:hypothetical protein